MEFKDSDRLGAKLYAINLRVAELDQEVQQRQVHVTQLESRLEDAKLAHLVGGDAGDPAEIGPELERSRGALESQQQMLDQVKKSQWKARVQYTMQRAKERQKDRQQQAPE